MSESEHNVLHTARDTYRISKIVSYDVLPQRRAQQCVALL